MNQNLVQSARKLRLSGLLLSLEMRLQEATSHQLSHEQFLELVLQDELNVRAHRRVERRKKAAAFRELKPLDQFDWDFNPSIKRAESLLEIIVRRHQNRSTLMTSNRPIEEWGQLLGDVPAATAILDRFLQQADLIPITGRSYRLRNQKDNSGPAAGKKR